MKRALILGTLAVLLSAPSAALVGGCHPSEPKQAASADPLVGDDPSATPAASAGSSGSASNSAGGSDPLFAPPAAGKAMGAPGKGEATQVGSLAAQLEGLRWGMTHAEVVRVFTETGGVLWKDYDAKLSKARVGPEMTAIENEREQAKLAFSRSFIEFKDTPTGYDATGIRGEYTYRNRESLLAISRAGKKRFFFFFNDRLWKLYDEVPLAESGPLGKTYVDAVNKWNADLGAQGRIQPADASKGLNATTVDWKDSANHVRVVDRSGERTVGVVIEENATLGNLPTLRANKAEDPTAIDPSIAAVTKGGLSDPNATKPAGSGSVAGKKPPPKKK